MKEELANEIIECLPKERTLFRYFKDRYALLLLNYYIGDEKKVSEIKKSKYSKLLNKDIVKSLLAECGGNILAREKLNDVYPIDTEYFVLTLGKYDGDDIEWSQTSRKGWNLVLQLNFSNKHDIEYKKLVKPEYPKVLNFDGHPVYEQKDDEYFRETLAWSRIDIDFVNNEVLIEEIQSDWVREAKDLLEDALWYKKNNHTKFGWWDIEGKIDDVIEYCQKVIMPYTKIWSEAMMMATIDFIKNELGVNNIFYHTDKSGFKIKGIKYDKPPRSLYTKLPSQFCFEKTSNEPEMLLTDSRYKRLKRKVKDTSWYELAI